MEPLRIENQQLLLLDQRLLPNLVEYVTCADWQSVAQAITKMVVRGAPAIGAAAAYGMAIAATNLQTAEPEQFAAGLEEAASGLQAARPTAVNLAWAVERMLNVLRVKKGPDIKNMADLLWQEADRIAAEDVVVNKKIGEYGASLIPDRARILTHCNAGALATVGYGTALGVIRSAVAQGKDIAVYADETRPYLQGARLTAWEMVQEKIPVTLIADNMAGFLLKQGKVDLIIVGADRIAANGDTANKIGTYALAVLAQAHQVPFYVAAPASTFDLSLADGEQIPIEERSERELTHFYDTRIAPIGVQCYNPAFDITPAELITAIITEHGIIERPTKAGIAAVLGETK